MHNSTAKNGSKPSKEYAEQILQRLSEQLLADTSMSVTEKIMIYNSTAAHLGMPENEEAVIFCAADREYLRNQERLAEWKEKRDELNASRPATPAFSGDWMQENPWFEQVFWSLGIIAFMGVVAMIMYGWLLGGGQ